MARTILAPYDGGNHNLSIAGPDIECGANASTSFALLLHEFATNAVKYGALAQPNGGVQLSWRIEGALILDWIESGIDLAPSENGEGFGSTLVQATVSTLGGAITREWSNSGLNIQLTIPLDRIGI